jgi:hypothetical protein
MQANGHAGSSTPPTAPLTVAAATTAPATSTSKTSTVTAPPTAAPHSSSPIADASWLAWPLTVGIIFLILMWSLREVVVPFAQYVWRRDPPVAPVAGADVVVAMNLGRFVSEDDVVAATRCAKTVLDTAPNNPSLAMTSAPAKAGGEEQVKEARVTLTAYFERVYSAMLRSQMRALKTVARRNVVNLGDVTPYYDDAAERGAAIAFRDWLDYLDRYGFIDMSTIVGGAGMTSISITALGRLFVGWCDAKAFSGETLAASGRPF